MKSLKTITNLETVRNCILKFKMQKSFSYKEISKELRLNGLKHEMNFYYFVYSGAVILLSKGEYAISEKMSWISNDDVYRIGTQHILKLRKIKQQKELEEKNINTNSINTKSIDNYEQQCILFLKSKGYKILKPINEYQEI